jgi:hypothetical protein
MGKGLFVVIIALGLGLFINFCNQLATVVWQHGGICKALTLKAAGATRAQSATINKHILQVLCPWSGAI